jgi:hypothetical protein
MAMVMATQPADATSYLENGSFETGDFTGWTLSAPDFSTSVRTGSFGGLSAQDGLYYVTGGPFDTVGSLSQTFTDTAGQTLIISGWVGKPQATDPSSVGFYFNGTQLFFQSPVTAGPDWVHYSFIVAATGSDTFAVQFQDNADNVYLDNFSINTPLPAALPLFATGFGVIGLLARRRKQKAAIV